MKINFKTTEIITLMFSMLMLIQSCTVYRSVPASLQEAVEKNTKVKIVTKDNKKLKYRYLGQNGNLFYGVSKQGRAIIKTPIDKNAIGTIKIKDKTMSTILSIVAPVAIVIGLGAIIIDSVGYGIGSGSITIPYAKY